ncbi:polysaccharide lyase family 8 super-sandwich domain-containing protein [Bacteroides sp.]
MKNTLLLILFICLSIANARSQQPGSEIELIKNHYIRSLVDTGKENSLLLQILSKIPPEKEVSDQNVIELHQLYPIGEKEIHLLVESQQTDGSWNDINYADTKRSGWEPKQHAERILKLAKYYYKTKDKAVSETIHKAMNFWFTSQLVCKNWWYNQIGIPRTLGPAFLLFEQEMSTEEKQAAIRVMEHSKLGMTGQNKVWLAGNVLLQGLLQNDMEAIRKSRDVICSEIILGQEEGIQPDWSFHQHGPQQQFGNYGLSFIANMGFYSGLFAGTSLAFNAQQQDVLVSLLLKGYQWIVWKGYWDVNGLNRQLFHNADIHKPLILLLAANSLLKNSTREQAILINAFIDSNYQYPEKENAFTGNKFFCNSDLTIHRTPQWMASLRMASNRVIGTELINEDNLKGYYMADGALYTYIRGDEYHNIFPFWDWRKIPGITTYDKNDPIPAKNDLSSRNRTSMVGGTSYKDTGITAMQLNRDGLNAYKTWIFTKDFIVCMGSGIHSDSIAPLLTSIDQRFSKGSVWSNRQGRYFHDNTGYIVLQADSCVAGIEKRSGQWHDFMGMYKPRMLENEIFSIYLKHPTQKTSSYLYLILPASTISQTDAFDISTVRTQQNDEVAQVTIIEGICYVTAWKATSIKLSKGKEIKIKEPGTYVFGKDGTLLNSYPFPK